MNSLHSINREQKLFVINSGHGFSCLGFDVLETRCVALSRELVALGYSLPMPAFYGTAERFGQYANRVEIAREHHAKTGYRFHCDLTPELNGLEGRRVEVVTPDGDKSRFEVGKSTGFIPCHIALHNRRSLGGAAVYMPKGSTVRTIA